MLQRFVDRILHHFLGSLHYQQQAANFASHVLLHQRANQIVSIVVCPEIVTFWSAVLHSTHLHKLFFFFFHFNNPPLPALLHNLIFQKSICFFFHFSIPDLYFSATSSYVWQMKPYEALGVQTQQLSVI